MSFSIENQISLIETRAGRFMRESLVRRIVSRDEELLGRMQKGGPPTSVPLGVIPIEGDLIYSSAGVRGGTVYCDRFTVNPGVVLSVDRFLIVKAATEIIIHGHVNADEQGGYGGIPGDAGTKGDNGISPGGGGGGGHAGGGNTSWVSDGGPGGNGPMDLQGGVGGLIHVPINGAPGATHVDVTKAAALAGLNNYLAGGAGGGGPGHGTIIYDIVLGGRGGGVIIFEAPSIIVSASAMITARGGAGLSYGVNSGTGGGGGGGAIVFKGGSVSLAAGSILSVTGGVSPATGGARSAGGSGADGIVHVEVYE